MHQSVLLSTSISECGEIQNTINQKLIFNDFVGGFVYRLGGVALTYIAINYSSIVLVMIVK